MIADAESILRICGIGTCLHIGCGKQTLVFELLKRSIDAYGLDSSTEIVHQNLQRAPGRFFQGSLTNYPFKQSAFDTLIIGDELLQLNPADLAVALKILLLMTKRNLVLYFPSDVSKKIQAQHPGMSRLYWEKIAIEAGFRRHPREMLVNHYQSLENEKTGRLTFFERIPDAALQQFPMSWLLANRDLHMDMLREAGRRSDGHVSRYVLAALRVRPGDIVLDAACGLGYGTAVLSACSPGTKFIGVDIDPDSVAYANANYAAGNPSLSYQASDVTKLSFIADHSIDTVVSFETIEHVKDYDAFLAEVKRVLKPDGRFIGSVPNLWCDETGKDPNPHHFHVFDWAKLYAAISKYFIVDGTWAQVAGGGYKHRDGKRVMESIPLELGSQINTEWWIISACVDPREKQSLPYTNPFHKDENALAPVHVDFAKYYDNPWLYRVMVQLGERLSERNVLISYCSKVAHESKPGSADRGAALCVIAYQLLEVGQPSNNDITIMINEINAYDAAYDRQNPHALRWAISLHYVGARLLLAIGNRDEALKAFISCAEMDPMPLSPLLATKTISSRMYAGLIYAGMEKLTEAQEQFKLAIKEAHRVMQGDWKNLVGHDFENPLSFGLQEAAEVLDIASQCSQALIAIKRQHSVPGYFWDKINLKRFGLVEWNKSLERENQMLLNMVAERAN